MKRNWIRKAIIGFTICATVGSVSAHSLSRTFNILPFGGTLISTYNKTDSSTKVGISLRQAATGEVRDPIRFIFRTNGKTIFSKAVTEGESFTTTYSSFGNTVDVEYGHDGYNLSGHSVYGTLYW